MSKCDVCGNTTSRETTVSEVFNIEGRLVMVENIPAKACARCGEMTFDRAIAEKIRRIAHDHKRARRHISVDVFAYA
jgi:YgiT-type zinc finger domain-containing protein